MLFDDRQEVRGRSPTNDRVLKPSALGQVAQASKPRGDRDSGDGFLAAVGKQGSGAVRTVG